MREGATIPMEYPGPFIQFDTSPWSAFLASGMKRTFPAQADIVRPGDRVRYLYYVEQGDILITHFFSADDSFKLNIIGERAVAGIVEVFSPVLLKSSWHTLRPCVCFLFTREQVENELPKSLMGALLEQVSLMGATMAERFIKGAGKRHDVRLARFLLHFAETRADQDPAGTLRIIPAISQEVSSELLGMHPVTFNKLLAAYRKLGIIGRSKKSGLEILDKKALAQYATGAMPPLS